MPIYLKEKLSNRHAQLIFVSVGVLSLISVLIAAWTEEYLIAFIPIVGLLASIFTLRPSVLFYTFIIVLPFAIEMDIGPFGLDFPSEPLLIGLALFSTFWLIFNLEKSKILFAHPITILVILHLFWAYCSIIFSSHPVFSLKFALSKSWFIVGSLVASFWLINSKDKITNTLIVLVGSTAVTIMIIMIRHWMLDFTFDSINKASHPIYRNHVIYGVFIVMIYPFVFVLRTLTKKHSIQRLAVDLCIVLFGVGIFFTYTRGAWLAIPVMLLVIVSVKYRLLRFAYPIAVVLGIAFFAYLSQDYRFLKYAPDYESTIYHDEIGDHLAATFEGKDMSTMERFHRWVAAFRLFKEHPIVGTGTSTFVDRYKPYTSTNFETYISENEERSTVHNYFIFALVEQGGVGFLIIVLLVGTYFIYSERQYHLIADPVLKRIYLASILCGAAFWLNNLFSDLVEANKVAPLWFFTIAWLVTIEQIAKKGETEKN